MAQQDPSPEQPQVVILPEGAQAAKDGQEGEEEEQEGVVLSPAKVLRIGSMIKQTLEELRRAPLDEAGRARLRELHDVSIQELAEGLSDDLKEELARLALPFDSEAPSEPELRIAQAQMVGWLEGLFHGIQATLFAQQMAARAQFDELQRRGLPAGAPPGVDPTQRPGTYL
jgi:hypothetical protein